MNTFFTGCNLQLLNSYLTVLGLIFTLLFFITTKFELSYNNNNNTKFKSGTGRFINKIKLLMFKADDDAKSFYARGVLQENPKLRLADLKNRDYKTKFADFCVKHLLKGIFATEAKVESIIEYLKQKKLIELNISKFTHRLKVDGKRMIDDIDFKGPVAHRTLIGVRGDRFFLPQLRVNVTDFFIIAILVVYYTVIISTAHFYDVGYHIKFYAHKHRNVSLEPITAAIYIPKHTSLLGLMYILAPHFSKIMFLDYKSFKTYMLYILLVSDQNVKTIILNSEVDSYDPDFPYIHNAKDLKMQNVYDDIELYLQEYASFESQILRKKANLLNKKLKFQSKVKPQASLVKLV
jgi:hypothetical protein